ncbi:hypothetical protein F3Y22_tig00110257pilonHSYRG00098 [Hibiscus syriacus]|uniref:Zinc knuckle CX2CX4HX4C domain-containing protein n=1 Tax=Hibiscus syriacus TaxID=106335 RepID=A0A6A3B6H9_HIBSY|nr:hypothetical protein F3Y22_tig00110257pilonHSYRG00098 [Hibiscus syriacus]
MGQSCMRYSNTRSLDFSALSTGVKTQKKLTLKNGTIMYALFQYEKLRLFCFIYGKLGHCEKFCPLRVLQEKKELIPQWGLSIRAPSRRKCILSSHWLREQLIGGVLSERLRNADKMQADKGGHNDDIEMVAEAENMPFVIGRPGIPGPPFAMKLISWNVLGLGQPRAVRRLQHLLKDFNPALGGVEVDDRGSSGGLCLAWHGYLNVSVRSFSSSHIEFIVSMEDSRVWRCTGSYGASEESCQLESWNLLRTLNDCPEISWWHFKFEAVWLTKDSCEEEVARLWSIPADSMLGKLENV